MLGTGTESHVICARAAQRVANDSPCGYEWRTDNNGKGGILKQLIQRIIKGKNSLKGNMTKLRALPAPHTEKSMQYGWR